jgi:hypothetical protein
MEIKKLFLKTIAIVLILTIITGTFGSSLNEDSSTTEKEPLKKIILSKNTINLKEGKKARLTVKYTPKNTTENKKIKWTSSKSKIATVKNGVVTAKKVGTTTITAKVGTKTAKCKIYVKEDGNFVDASKAYVYLNLFRTKKGVWYWNKDGKTKTYFNKNKKTKLKALSRNAKLEKVAKVRAKEIAKYFSHTRPNGRDCFTAYPNNLLVYGENIADGESLTAKEATELWKEINYKYAGQGHRRNMLDKDFKIVGIAGYKKRGRVYWVQAFGAK